MKSNATSKLQCNATDWLAIVVAAVVVIIAVLFFAALAFSVEGIVVERGRDPAVARAYLKSINLTKTPKGCQVDHVIPLHCGGPDIVENLQLICGPSLKAKEKYERNCETFKEWSKQCLVP